MDDIMHCAPITDNGVDTNNIKTFDFASINFVKLRNEKYELTDDTRTISDKNGDHVVHRIKALRDIGEFVKEGDLGGYVESEYNLSTTGDCWIHHDAIVCGRATISSNARVNDRAIVCNYAKVYENATIWRNAIICDFANVYGDAVITNNAIIKDTACISGKAHIYDKAIVRDRARVFGYAKVGDNAKLLNHATVFDRALICGNAIIKDRGIVDSNAIVKYNAVISEENAPIAHAVVMTDISKDLEESIRTQLGIIPFNGEIIVYKKVNKDLTSFWDPNFKYEVGKWIECEDVEESNRACTTGLHFSNATLFDDGYKSPLDSTYLIAKVRLEDIITVQSQKIRCRRAFILGTYNVGEK